ncbi:hypothetical protein PROVRUST_08257 [Providencia rustigianii DSM 4541]|uniref:Uncharacterized protein n=1 Tax=Providencia rustigianii DSM 4541 TaxID=500637 RepID=D1P7N4_9GAMM|nr:hypothetical protein PROVRUST_08257 [Providencia rustigianii DSM 4541]
MQKLAKGVNHILLSVCKYNSYSQFKYVSINLTIKITLAY